MDDDDNTNRDAVSVEYGVRRSRGATTLEWRYTSVLYSGQFMTMDVLLSIAEDVPTGLFPCLLCDEIFAVLAAIVPRYANPTTPEELINLRLSNLRQLNKHMHARYKELFELFSIPRRLMMYRKRVQIWRLIVMSFFLQIATTVCSAITAVVLDTLRRRWKSTFLLRRYCVLHHLLIWENCGIWGTVLHLMSRKIYVCNLPLK